MEEFFRSEANVATIIAALASVAMAAVAFFNARRSIKEARIATGAAERTQRSQEKIAQSLTEMASTSAVAAREQYAVMMFEYRQREIKKLEEFASHAVSIAWGPSTEEFDEAWGFGRTLGFSERVQLLSDHLREIVESWSDVPDCREVFRAPASELIAAARAETAIVPVHRGALKTAQPSD